MSDHFKTEEISHFRIIHCLVELNEKTLSELIAQIGDPDASWTTILDFENRNCDEMKFFRAITPLGLQLKKQSRKIYVVQAPDSFRRMVMERGMNGIIAVFPKLSDVLNALQARPVNLPAKEKADAVFLNTFIDATIKIIQLQCNVAISAKSPCKKGTIPEMHYEIAGVIGLTSNAFRGSIAICYPQQTFLALMSSMLGETFTEITNDLEDGAAELLNIIFGQAKTMLNESSYEIEKAIPTVVRGQDVRMSHPSSSPTIVIPFESPAGELRIEITFETQADKKAA